MRINGSKSTGKKIVAVVAVVAALLVLHGALWICRQRERDQLHQAFMGEVFSDLYDMDQTVGKVLAEDADPTARYDSFLLLRFQLADFADGFQNAHYLDESIPSGAYWYFLEADTAIGEDVDTAQLLADGTLSPAAQAALEELEADLQDLIGRLTGPDGQNMDQELTIEEFSQEIQEFYQQWEDQQGR